MPVAGRRDIQKRLQALGFTASESEIAVETLIDELIVGLIEEGKVTVGGFGSFTVRTRRSRTTKLPGREPRRVPTRLTVRFKASPAVWADQDGGR